LRIAQKEVGEPIARDDQRSTQRRQPHQVPYLPASSLKNEPAGVGFREFVPPRVGKGFPRFPLLNPAFSRTIEL
jgi:hypothetical protein